jgi:hypothetical protein
MTERIPMDKDYFTLMEFSAKWDPIPSMLCHTQLVKGFMGQTTDSALIKSNVLIMGSCELNGALIFMAKKEKECLPLRRA